MKMEYLVTAPEMKEFDKNTIETIGIPSCVLMERAALATVAGMHSRISDLHKKAILIVCGTGNNGGDGMAIGRLLLEERCKVDVLLTGEIEKYSEEAFMQKKILDAYDVKYLTKYPEREYNIIIDALFGVGLTREIQGDNRLIVEQINKSNAIIVAVDIPSGVNATDGQIMGCAVKSQITATYGYMKRGLKIFPGRAYCGDVFCDRIGITEKSFQNHMPSAYTYREAITQLLPKRYSDGNKGSFGKLLIIGGQENMSGAVQLCTMGALGSGVGMVKVMTHEQNRMILQCCIPEAMVMTWNHLFPEEELYAALQWADGVVIGPGFGEAQISSEILEYVLKHCDKNIILDADGLNLVSKNRDLQDLVKMYHRNNSNSQLILTPHQGELSRLIAKPVSDIKKSSGAMAQKLAEEWNVVVVSKDATTFVCRKNMPLYINVVGNDGMATGGSGDVLAGIIGAFVVQGMGVESACMGVYLHSIAGDWAAEKKNKYSMTARDIIEALNDVLK